MSLPVYFLSEVCVFCVYLSEVFVSLFICLRYVIMSLPVYFMSEVCVSVFTFLRYVLLCLSL